MLCNLAHWQASHGARTAYLVLRFGVGSRMLFLTFAGAMSGGLHFMQFMGCGPNPASVISLRLLFPVAQRDGQSIE